MASSQDVRASPARVSAPGAPPPREAATAPQDDDAAHDSSSHDGSKPAARKDRMCPYCRQPFTSSSLGRHLDLYIKDKNPKAPDGLHDVEQIRKMRRGITRRHARNSHVYAHATSGKHNGSRDTSTPISGRDAHSPSLASPKPLYTTPQVPQLPHSRVAASFNRLAWQATGVINDLPPRNASAAGSALHHGGLTPRDTTALDPLRPTAETRMGEQEERDTGQAAELALRELLQVVHAARVRAEQASLFDVDVFTHDFPALVLYLLPPPPSVFASSPVPTSANEVWPLTAPPGPPNHDALRTAIFTRFSPRMPPPLTSLAASALASALSQPNPPQDAMSLSLRRHLDHLYAAHEHWLSLSPSSQQDAWHLALMRHAATRARQTQDAKSALARVELEVDHLRSQIEGMRSAGLHSLAAFATPARERPGEVTPELARELSANSGGANRHYDSLVDRWKNVVRAGRTGPSTMTGRGAMSLGAGQGQWPQQLAPMAPKLPDAREERQRQEHPAVEAGINDITRRWRSDYPNVGDEDGEGDVDMDDIKRDRGNDV